MSDGADRQARGGSERRPVAGAGQGAKPPQARRRPGPFIPFERFEDVVVRCGHVEKFGLLPDSKDRFRDDRRKKAISRDCKACRERKQLEEQQAAEQRRAEKELRKAQGGSQQRQGKARGPHAGRLPDGSRFEVVYDGTKQQWTGTLTVPGPDGTSATFTGSGSGLFPLLSNLDVKYRESLS